MDRNHNSLNLNINKFNKIIEAICKSDCILEIEKFNQLLKQINVFFDEYKKHAKIIDDLIDDSGLEFMSIVTTNNSVEDTTKLSELNKNIIVNNSNLLSDKNNVNKVIGHKNLIDAMNLQYSYLRQSGKSIFEYFIKDKKYVLDLYNIYCDILDEIKFKLNKYNKFFNFNNGANNV
jgi:hypothetical protein